MKDIRKVVIPVAGWGTRSLPATKNIPKEMLPIYNKPVIQYVVEEAQRAHIKDVIFVTNRDKNVIEDHFDHNLQLEDLLERSGKLDKLEEVRRVAEMVNILSVRQKRQLGLGHAVHCAAEKTGDEPFYVLLGDVLVPDNNMLPAMQKVSDEHNGASVIAVMPVPDDQVNRFGVIAGSAISDDVWKIDGLVEKPALEDAPSNLAVFGRYLLSARVMELLAEAKPTVGGEIQEVEQDIREWVSLMKRYMGATEVDRELLLKLIDKIVVGQKTTVDGEERQEITIHYNLVGTLD